jgi:hypothetical protein
MENAAAMVTKAPQSLALRTVLGITTTLVGSISTGCAYVGAGGS